MNAHAPRASYNAFEGIHRFKPNGGAQFNAFEIFYKAASTKQPGELAGWYWRPLPIDDLPDPTPIGPFTSSRAAYRDARSQS